MLRAVALRLESGAITCTSSSGILRSSAAQGVQPRRLDPVVVGDQNAHRPPILGRGNPWLAPWRISSGRSPGAGHGPGAVSPARSRGAPPSRDRKSSSVRRPPADLEHRPDQHPDHAAHEGVGLDPELEHPALPQDRGLLVPLGAEDVPLEADVLGLGGREGGEVVRPAQRVGAARERARDRSDGARTARRPPRTDSGSAPRARGSSRCASGRRAGHRTPSAAASDRSAPPGPGR